MTSPPAASSPARTRTAAVLVAAVAAVVLVVLAGARAAGPAAPLPEVGTDELLGSVTSVLADPPPVSGEIAGTLELGLPDEALERSGARGSELTGDQRLRIWRSGDGLRVARLGRASERAFITDGRQTWTWDSRTLEATRREVPAPDGRQSEQVEGFLRGLTSGDPTELAGRALAAIDERTAVSVQGSARVAGRDVYRLQVEPRSAESLVGRIEIDIDAEERVPLRSAVYARDAVEPSIEAAFTSVSFEPIDPETFAFSPPPGAQVRQVPAGEHGGKGPDGAGGESRSGAMGRTAPGAGPDDAHQVRTIGEGWTTVVAIPQESRAGGGQQDARATAGLDQVLPFNGPLFSARAEQVDGQRWLLVGAVEQPTLEQAAQALR